MQEQYRKTNEAIKNAANVQMAVALHTVIIGLGVRKLAVSDGLADLTGNELLSSRGRALVNREQELHIAQKVLCELLVKECRGRWCKTMDRPASSCGCPDCGSSLIDFPSKATPEAAPSLISSLKSILADADVGPPTDSDGCCRECGQWTPWRHPESHDHEDGCTAPREYAKRRDWKSRLSALISNTPAAVQTHAEAAAALGINSALTRIQAGNHAEAIEPLEHALRVLAATPAAEVAAPVLAEDMKQELMALYNEIMKQGRGMHYWNYAAAVLARYRGAFAATPAATAPVMLPEPDVQLCAVEDRLQPVVRKTVGASPGRPLDLYTADTVRALLATAQAVKLNKKAQQNPQTKEST